MKLFSLFMIIGFLQLHAKGVSQKVTLDLRQASLSEAFKEIKKQTGYVFWFDEKLVRQARPVSVSLNDVPLDQALQACLKDQKLSYAIEKKVIVITAPRPSSGVDDLIPAIPIRVRVVDAGGSPLAGASVINKNTGNSGVTDAEGVLSLNVNVDDVLEISFVGFVSQLFTVKDNSSTLTIVLKPSDSKMDEVVVNAGYYDVKDREKTGSISKVTSDVIEKQPVINPIATLSGRMPGVFIQQSSGIPGGDVNIEIRGRSSLRSSPNGLGISGNVPLYIVDGVPFSPEKVSNHENAGPFVLGGVSPLTSINPADIERIDVLKDADATAIYGSRGANGVILITTKKGRSGKTKFEINAFTGGGKAPLMKIVNTQQYLGLRKEGFRNDGLIPSADPQDDGRYGKLYAPDVMVWDTTRYTNWPKESIGGTAITSSIQSSLSGGNEYTQFLFTTGFRKEGSVFRFADPNYLKGSVHLSVNHLSSNKKLSVNISFSGTQDKNSQFGNRNYIYMAYLQPDAPPLYNVEGALNWANSTWENPLAPLKNTFVGRTGSLISNVVVGYELLPGLKIKTSLGLNSLGSKEVNLSPSTQYNPADSATSAVSEAIIGRGSNQSWIIEPQVSWEKRIAKGQFSALMGGTFQGQALEKSVTIYRNFPSDALIEDLLSAASVYNYSYTKSLYRYAAIFGRLNYTWDGKYIINLTGRRDGSSRFGPGNQFANFGAIGLGWIFSEESFIKNEFPVLSFGKLRGSFGVTGNDQIDNYQFLDTYASGGSGIIYQGNTGLVPTRLFNPNYAWETNQKFEVALETAFFQDRILLNIGYYSNRSSNQLIGYPLPMTTGFTSIQANFPATVSNTGVEVELTTINIRTTTIQWSTSFNLTAPRNKLVNFPNIESSTYADRYVVGKSIYIQKLYESTGVDPQTGLYTFRDFNNDDVINEDDRKKVVFIGQDFYGGLNNSLSWNGFSLDVFFQFVKQTGYNEKQATGVLSAYVLDLKRWQKPGDIADLQRLATSVNREAIFAESRYGQSDAVIGDASYIRLKNIALSYKVPGNWIKPMMCRFYVQCQNLFVISKYKGYDPESQFLGIAPLRVMTVGIQASL